MGPGDQVTVTISQLGTGFWAITVSDVTRGKTFTTEQSYDGPLASAEWILEAPSDNSGNVLPLAPFSPAVTFGNLGVAGGQTALWANTMESLGVPLATPSIISNNQFTVSYAGGSLLSSFRSAAPHQAARRARVAKSGGGFFG